MLSVASKTRRRRRRRPKRSMAANNATEANNVDDDESDEKVDSKNKTFSPKVNSKFINEDVEIETAMLLKQLTKDSAIALRKQRAIEFFTVNIGAEMEHSARKSEGDEDEILPDDEQENYPDGPQLASSYFNDGFDAIVVPFDSQATGSFDAQQFYVPELSLPKQIPDDIEAPDLGYSRNVIDEGHFVGAKPSIYRMNRALFINRLVEEGAMHWFDYKSGEIQNLRELVLNRRLFKAFCAERFHPIEYPPTLVHLEMDAYTFPDRILRIHLKHLHFEVHPTFNEEQKLARELESLYDQFVAAKQYNVLGKIETKLKILRQLLDTLAKSHLSHNPNKAKTDSMLAHREELEELRTTWHNESAKHRALVKSILEKWTELKRIREGVAAPASALKLMIKVQTADAEKDEIEWSELFEMEHRERMDEAMEVYRKQKSERKKNKETGERIVKPSTKKIEQQLLNIFAESMRPPGEEIIDFELERGNTSTIKSPPKYVVRLALNDGHLDFPDSTKLDDLGQAHFNAIFSIKFTTKISNVLKFQVRSDDFNPIF